MVASAGQEVVGESPVVDAFSIKVRLHEKLDLHTGQRKDPAVRVPSHCVSA